MDMNDMDLSSSSTKKVANESSSQDPASCPHSGLRLKNREKPAEYVDSIVSSYKFLHCHYVANGHNPGEQEWASIGVVVQKISPQTVDKKGNKFTIFSLSNMRDIPKVIKIMAFGEVRFQL